MNKYFKFFNKLMEADRSRFINPNPNLTDEQKEEIINTFKKYNNIGNDIKWGSKEVSNWTYDKFKPYLDKVGKTKTFAKKNGVSGLVEGEDYILIDETEEYTAYRPLSHFGSKILASNATYPPVMTPPPRWSEPEDWGDNPAPLMPNAKWCISMNTSSHWDSYVHNGYSFVFVCYKNEEVEMNYKKIALVFLSNELVYAFNAADDQILKDNDKPNDKYERIISKYRANNVNKYILRSKCKYNEETGRYDVSDSLLYNFSFPSDFLDESGDLLFPIGTFNGDITFNESFSNIDFNKFPQKIKGNIIFNEVSKDILRRINKPFYRKVTGFVRINDSDVSNIDKILPVKYANKLFIDRCYSSSGILNISTELIEDIRIVRSDIPLIKRLPITQTFCLTECTCKDKVLKFNDKFNINDYFEMYSCNGINSIENLPITSSYYITDCDSLEHVEGFPDEVYSLSIVDCPSIKEVKWPSKVETLLDIENCDSLRNAKDIPKSGNYLLGNGNTKVFTDEQLGLIDKEFSDI